MNAMVDPIHFEAPLFKTARGALLFAFNFTHGTVKKPFIASLVGGNRPGRGLSGLDGAGQAGMILAEVRQMEGVRQRILACRYSPQKNPCACRRPCCGGFVLNPEWAEAVEWLTDHILKAALAGTVSNFRLRRALVCRYFGLEISISRVADECRVKRDTAAEHNKRVVTYFQEQERVADIEIQGRLESAGVVGA